MLTRGIAACAFLLREVAEAAERAPAGEVRETGLILAAVALVAIGMGVAALMIRRWSMTAPGTGGAMELLAQYALGPRQRLVLMRVGPRYVLLAHGAGETRLLLELDADEVAEFVADDLPENPVDRFRNALSRLLQGRGDR